MTYIEHAIKTLRTTGRPAHYRELTERALAAGLQVTTKTPASSMYTSLLYEMKKPDSRLIRTGQGLFALREWPSSAEVSEVFEDDQSRVRVPHFPVYEEVRSFLRVLEGRRAVDFTSMKSTINGLTGTPQNPMDWSDPDAWIEERLEGEDRQLALEIWQGTGRLVNPRHALGHWLLARRFELLVDTPSGEMKISPLGSNFLSEPTGAAVSVIDEQEGLLHILSIVATHGPGWRNNFIEPWGEFLRRHSKHRSDKSFEVTLYGRLQNLVARGYIDRSGISYAIADAGLVYLNETEDIVGPEKSDEIQSIRNLVNEARKAVRDSLLEMLLEMDPIDFEHLIKRLLQRMGYDEPTVTSPGNDKGVDVVASIEVGITSVTEVIQVKRFTNNIHRPVLDQLRGSLHRFGAMRGTIITTSDFSKGTQEAAFEPGAAPVTLIDGQKLVELLIEHRIGVRSEKIEVLRLEPGDLVRDEELEAEAAE